MTTTNTPMPLQIRLAVGLILAQAAVNAVGGFLTGGSSGVVNFLFAGVLAICAVLSIGPHRNAGLRKTIVVLECVASISGVVVLVLTGTPIALGALVPALGVLAALISQDGIAWFDR